MNIAFFGYGKMAKAVEKVALESEYKVVLIVNRKTSIKQLDSSKFAIDLAFEFSSPETAYQNIAFCLEHNITVISGTTGWLERFTEIETLVNKTNGTFFYASNFSLGVNLFFKLNKLVAAKLNKYSYSVEIKETHHTEKNDSPSGTAISLANEIINEDNSYLKWVNGKAHNQIEVPIESNRVSGVSGTHEVIYKNRFEQITLAHKALSREGFAQGAVAVAHWISGKRGVLNMEDFLDD